jgi:hypothetical protein
MKTERVRAVWRSCRKDSRERAAPVRARINLKHITSCPVQPSDDNDPVANCQPVKTLYRKRFEFNPSIGCILSTLFGCVAPLLVFGSDHTDRLKQKSPATPAMLSRLHTVYLFKCVGLALRLRSGGRGLQIF